MYSDFFFWATAAAKAVAVTVRADGNRAMDSVKATSISNIVVYHEPI